MTCTVDGCEKPQHSRGWCGMHYARWHKHGSVDVVKVGNLRDATERFWEKVEKTETCWLWTAGLNRAGYGDFHLDGKMLRAHRWAYEQAYGPIPDGMQIDHVYERGCRHKNCVRPDHLEAVDNATNQRRRFDLVTECVNGHPLSGDNLRVTSGKVTQRRCRTCERRWGREAKARKRHATGLSAGEVR